MKTTISMFLGGMSLMGLVLSLILLLSQSPEVPSYNGEVVKFKSWSSGSGLSFFTSSEIDVYISDTNQTFRFESTSCDRLQLGDFVTIRGHEIIYPKSYLFCTYKWTGEVK